MTENTGIVGLVQGEHNFAQVQKRKRRPRRLRSMASRHDICEFSRQVGQRLADARNLCSMSQKEAAAQLGYETSSKLCKVESGSSAEPSSALLRDAALLYDVPTDYLLGITSGMVRGESDQRLYYRELKAHLLAQFDRRHAQDILVLDGIQDSITDIRNLISLASSQIRAVQEEMERIAKSDEWQDIVGGNRLVNRIEALGGTLSNAAKRHNMNRQVINASKNISMQLDLIL